MFEQLKSYFQFGNQFCGVEHINKNGSDTIVVTILKKSKKQIEVDESFEVGSVELLKNKLSKKQHIYLVLNNEKVLTKNIESSQVDHLKLVNKAFPNIDINDFYYEILHDKNSHFVFICRKEHVDDLIAQYKEFDFLVTNVFFGVSVISSIADFIDTDYVHTSNCKLSFKDGSIISIEKEKSINPQAYNINGLKTTNSNLLSLSGALNSALNTYHAITNFGIQKQLLLDDYYQKRFFSLFSKAGLVFLFGLLLINFFFFNHYFDKVNDLQQVSQVNQSAKTKFLKLSEEVNKTQKMVDDMMKSNTSKSAFYVNGIIQSLPNSIQLSGLNYQPLLKRIKKNQAITLEDKVIVVSGDSNDSELFSNWISVLENKNWIQKINILDYGASSKPTSSFSFKIIIQNE